MPLVTLKEILADAQRNHYAVGMFDTHNLETTEAIIQAAQEERSPVILALAEAHVKDINFMESIAGIMSTAAKRASVPVCLHLDHGTKLESIVRTMHLGFSSVMYDGSSLPYEENVAKTAEAVRIAKIFGASVEAELGHVGGAEGGEDDGHGIVYTDPVMAVDFIAKTEIDALAVSIGTVHGNYASAPKLDLALLSQIYKVSSIPLVLHGGSGLSDDDFRNCIKYGIRKINIYTDMVQAAVSRLRCEITTDGSSCGLDTEKQLLNDKTQLINFITEKVMEALGAGRNIKYDTLMERSVDGMKMEIVRKIRLFGSNGRV